MSQQVARVLKMSRPRALLNFVATPINRSLFHTFPKNNQGRNLKLPSSTIKMTNSMMHRSFASEGNKLPGFCQDFSELFVFMTIKEGMSSINEQMVSSSYDSVKTMSSTGKGMDAPVEDVVEACNKLFAELMADTIKRKAFEKKMGPIMEEIMKRAGSM